MSDPKKPPRPEPGDELLEVDELPPMDDGAVEDVDPEQLADYLSDFEEEPDSIEEAFGDEDHQQLAQELVEIEEGSWLGDDARQPDAEFDLDVDEEEAGWADPGAGETLGLDGQWFVEDDQESVVDDGGAEGPIDEGELEIDSGSWDELGGPDEDDDEPMEEVLGRLGIVLPGSSADDEVAVLAINHDIVTEQTFLGPRGGDVAALVAAGGGPPVVVGDGIFILGADGMLHRSEVPAKWWGTSVCTNDDLVFIGTQAAGAFAFDPRSQGILPINSWCDLGIGGAGAGGRVTTAFHVRAQTIGARFYLLGRTGAGQLFASHDLGGSWQGPLTDARCLALAPVAGSERTLVLVDSRRGPRLLRSVDLERWNEVPLPDGLASAVGGAPLNLAASSDTIVVGVEDRAVPLFVTLDGGASWQAVEQARGATAVIVDSEDPGWIAAAIHREVRDLGVLRVSEDGGRTWKNALITGRERHDPNGEDERRGRISELALVNAGGRVIYVVAGEGVHRVALTRHGLSH